jgi:hypothetical protein
MNARLVAGAIAVLVGLVWIGQGLGYVPGSFMTGEPFWAIAGAVLVAVGAVIIVLDRRRRTAPPA